MFNSIALLNLALSAFVTQSTGPSPTVPSIHDCSNYSGTSTPLLPGDPTLVAAMSIAGGMDAAAAAALQAALNNGSVGVVHGDFTGAQSGLHDHDTIVIDVSQPLVLIGAALIHEWEHVENAGFFFEDGLPLLGDTRFCDPCYGCIYAQVTLDSVLMPT